MTFVLVAVGGAVGACVRFLLDRWIQRRHDAVFPFGTLTVNVVGSFVLGVLTGAALSGVQAPAVQLLVGVGFCGSLTTYSTFGYETVRLFTEGARLLSALNAVTTVLAGIGAGVLGVVVAAAVCGWPG
ncbi:CrcB protein [Saccharopolyspora erythraea NRRL 2338]|uniref:Fluoride-specific ion channel FluC n=2 Tax=Saccharopolyspora erythraea TaxID=1836 RepID=A4FQS0_SACEN|nr:fluoride efflux transporter CrcB [Saccharopolyspora erythraea]EQD87660.1 chromosome condensation protein CrcB [Saccharopolyspora erythraea D]PFG92997.1 CrcB protein [Saccharopolyspora erythraea NRRL 2338]QRK89887.1 fluoride efflux transporter CrcB [Saccharopolyspora erythraea]CAM06395.1 camphor resistance CrcB protein [Saccharopolyspora erythraea NRRL 2338]